MINRHAKYKSEIEHYSSFIEMEEKQLEYFASLQGWQLLRNLKILILMAYGIKQEPLLETMRKTINIGKP